MKKNRAWSALLIGIFITMIILIIAIYLLEKIVPFSRDIKGVENGNISYYRANTALNEALFSMSGNDPSIESSGGTVTNGSGTMYQIAARGNVIPKPGLWNSEYASDWAVLAPGKPIQLVLKSNNSIGWSAAGTYFTFRVPDLNKDGTWSETLSWWSLHPIINWTLSASGESLQASGSQIMANQILNGSTITLATKPGLTLSGSTYTFQTFYNNNCQPDPKVCSLKLSLVNPLVLTTGNSTPYLEYQARFDQAIPLQTAVIDSQGYAGGFRKNITRFIQQMTTNEALDFTVFQ